MWSSPRRPQGFARLRQRLGSLVGRGSRLRRILPGQGLFCLLLVTLLVGPNGALTSLSELGVFGQAAPRAAVPLTPVTQDQALAKQANAWGHAAGTQTRLSQYVAPPAGDVIPRQVLTPQPMITSSATLSATAATTLTTSDGRFSLTIPAGALSSSDLAAVGGPVALHVTQLAGPIGGVFGASESGHLSDRTYRAEGAPGRAFLPPSGNVVPQVRCR